MSGVIHLGMVIDEHTEPGFALVWIPTANSVVPPGFSEYKYKNTGGQLFGSNLTAALESSYYCRVASPLTSGTWWRSLPEKGASVFDDYSDNPRAYPIEPNAQTRHTSGINGYTFESDFGALKGVVATSTLSLAGGNPTHNIGTQEKGIFTKLKENQWVLVAFLDEGMNPVVINSVHSREAWEMVQG